ncbi:MAG TPA: hypothetical protein VHE61_08570 [Opitutaceae bacterium]|nr:hypothetical protein [Opitutaceae bacterium]
MNTLPRMAALAIAGAVGLSVQAARGQTFTYTGSLQTWTAPSAGTYEITAYGASGGNIANYLGTTLATGGKGAQIGGVFTLAGGQVLNLVVGGQGATTSKNGYTSGGGGGGSFVYSSLSLLVAAGGGGGAGDEFDYSYAGADGGAGQVTTSGQAGSGTSSSNTAGAGGTNGGGGGGGSFFNDGGGGAGWLGNGADGNTALGYSGHGGISFPSFAGGAGGATGYGGNGGYGGGGGGGLVTGGGGGGYSGGGGGAFSAGFANNGGGGGGGSYLDLSASTPIAIAGANSGDGMIVITSLQPAHAPDSGPGLPLEAAVLLGLGVAAGATVQRRRRA